MLVRIFIAFSVTVQMHVFLRLLVWNAEEVLKFTNLGVLWKSFAEIKPELQMNLVHLILSFVLNCH
jgi:hypothetical protein